MREEDNFNYWPAFTDLMIILVLVLVLLMSYFAISLIPKLEKAPEVAATIETTVPETATKETDTSTTISGNILNLNPIEINQKKMVDKIAHGHKAEYILNNFGHPKSAKISTVKNGPYDVFIINENTMQTLTFSDNILFKKDDDVLNDKGKEILTIVGKTIKDQIASLQEIQIRGHADTDNSGDKEDYNFQLASRRAISVVQFFKNEPQIDIDPAKYLISATSFGEYLSVARSENKEAEYSWEQLKKIILMKLIKAKIEELRYFYFINHYLNKSSLNGKLIKWASKEISPILLTTCFNVCLYSSCNQQTSYHI